MRSRSISIILSMLWTVDLVCCIIAYSQGYAPRWINVFIPILCLIMDNLTNALKEN